MKDELISAARLLCRLLRHSSSTLEKVLVEILHRRYRNYWFPDYPHKGSGYRVIRITPTNIDCIITEAGSHCDLSEQYLRQHLPQEFTLWIDPHEVSYRIGESGCQIIIYKKVENYPVFKPFINPACNKYPPNKHWSDALFNKHHCTIEQLAKYVTS